MSKVQSSFKKLIDTDNEAEQFVSMEDRSENL